MYKLSFNKFLKYCIKRHETINFIEEIKRDDIYYILKKIAKIDLIDDCDKLEVVYENDKVYLDIAWVKKELQEKYKLLDNLNSLKDLKKIITGKTSKKTLDVIPLEYRSLYDPNSIIDKLENLKLEVQNFDLLSDNTNLYKDLLELSRSYCDELVSNEVSLIILEVRNYAKELVKKINAHENIENKNEKSAEFNKINNQLKRNNGKYQKNLNKKLNYLNKVIYDRLKNDFVKYLDNLYILLNSENLVILNSNKKVYDKNIIKCLSKVENKCNDKKIIDKESLRKLINRILNCKSKDKQDFSNDELTELLKYIEFRELYEEYNKIKTMYLDEELNSKIKC